jgi:cell wall-associated NlpC family hydrolase
VAIQAAVSRQQTFVKLTKGKRNKLAGERAAAAAGPSGSSQVPAWAGGSGASASQGDIAANWALSQLGKPYQWGGAGPARYDCSGLTMVAWAHAGVQLLHYTGYQWQEGPHVPLSQLRRGDLLFYATNTSDPSTIHHVAIYIGHGMMVNAPYTGAFVRIDGMYAPGGLIGAVRPAG